MPFIMPSIDPDPPGAIIAPWKIRATGLLLSILWVHNTDSRDSETRSEKNHVGNSKMKFLHILCPANKASTSETTVKICDPTSSEDSITEITLSSDGDSSSSALSLFDVSPKDCYGFPSPPQKITSEDKGYAQDIPAPSSEDKCSTTKDDCCANGGEEEEIAPTTTSTMIVDGGTGEENSTAISRKEEDAGQYGYGDDNPTQDMSKYGYDDAPPTPRTITHAAVRSSSRRSSMKQGDAPRRASIQFGGGAETEVYVSSQRQMVQKRNSITFNECVYVRNVEPISSLIDDPEALWIQGDEYRETKDKMKRLANMVDTGSTGGRKYCVRGLEGFMKSNAQTRMNTKYQAWDSVLDEQCRQEDEEIFDDETLANSYKLASIGTKMVAVQRAKEDEIAIAEYTRSTRLMMRRLSC
jgi:hypothetical protein